jgi:signal transduction histidine kinase
MLAPPGKPDSAPPTERPQFESSVALRMLGDPARVGMENRVLTAMLLLAVITGAASVIQSIFLGATPVMLGGTIAGMLVGVFGYWVSLHSRRWRLFVTPIFILYLAVLIFCWMTQAGSNGTVSYYFFLLVSYAVVVYRGLPRMVAIVVLVTTVGTLMFIERWVPGSVAPYPTDVDRFTDMAFALPLCLLMTGTLMYVVYREYQRERQAKDALVRQVTEENERVEHAMREKQILLTVVCHDIANALTVLQGEIALSQAPTVAGMPPRPPGLDRMGYACRNIADIIGSVRLLEAVEQGRIALDPQPVDLHKVFRNAEMLFGERLRSRDMRISFPDPAPEARFVLAEPRILANQVFNNLVSNAIKFSRPGSTITVEVVREPDTVVLRVIDQGIGIPAELLAKLFDLEAKTTRPGTDGEPGTGFGLRTAKGFVDLFGGTIAISSRSETEHPADHGTTISVRLKPAPT